MKKKKKWKENERVRDVVFLKYSNRENLSILKHRYVNVRILLFHAARQTMINYTYIFRANLRVSGGDWLLLKAA